MIYFKKLQFPDGDYLKKIETTLSVGDGNILVSEAFFDNNLEVSNG